MPIYAFTCTACGHEFDRLQKLSDADPTVCPVCGAPDQVRRRLTAPQFRLAGGGWYETDFKKDGDSRRNLAGDSGAPKEAGSGSKEGGGSGDSAGAANKAPESKGGDAKPASGAASSGATESKPAPTKPAQGGAGPGSGGGSGAST